jgi:hypothetical protein
MSETSMESLAKWLDAGSTPVLWLWGPPGCGKSSATETVLRRRSQRALVLHLDAFDPERALAEALGSEPESRLTTRRLIQVATDQRTLILDGFDVLQERNGTQDVTDCRFRQLLFAACDRTLSPTRVVVTSQLRPPSLLSDEGLLVVEASEAASESPPSLPAAGTLERRILELAALARGAIDATGLARMSDIEPPAAHRALNGLAEAKLVRRVGRASYQVREVVRSSLVADGDQADSVREEVIEKLAERGADPERRCELLVDAGRVDEAVHVYWHDLGNYSRLHAEGRDHFGASLCRRLNNGSGPEELTPAFAASPGAWAVLNDWSQYALGSGDAPMCYRAAAAAHRALPSDQPPWNFALLAAHTAQGAALSGDLYEAMRWCERGWDHARDGMRRTQGIAVREVMDAYDWTANTIARIYLRLGATSEIRRLIDDLIPIHEYARQSVAEFNESSIISLSVPTGEITPEHLVDGRLAAMLALTEGKFDVVESLASSDRGTLPERELSLLKLRALLAANRNQEASELLEQLRSVAERDDDCATECDLAVLEQRTINDPMRRLAATGAYIPRSAACGLSLQWRELQLARARALRDLGRSDEACEAAEVALFGAGIATGAKTSGDRLVARDAASLLASLGRPLTDDVQVALNSEALPPRTSPPKPVKRRAPAASEASDPKRADIHATAVGVLKSYEEDGTPFALHFRKFGFEVLHGPFELGPRLTENAVRDALPPGIELITIQDDDTLAYQLKSSRFRREAPALLLDDAQWAEVVRDLIPYADLIVAEPVMLSDAVRLELQMVYDAHRWDRTVVVLPPLDSPVDLIDNDTLLQMFPRCVWADAFHTESLTASPVITDLLERIAAIARLPIEERRALRSTTARDQAFPIDLVHVAEHYEREAGLESIFGGGDDARTRYYAFWQYFRAAAIRAVQYQRGDQSTTTRCQMARSYLEMSKLMLDHSAEGDKFILQGDPAEAQMLVGSAHGLLEGLENDLWADALRSEAEAIWKQLVQLKAVMANNRERFEIRARYGPLIKRKVEK